MSTEARARGGENEAQEVTATDASVSATGLSLYINRELSWIEFNRRVLEEAADARYPLLERIKFLSIFNSNLDEFFMIRVSGLKEQLLAGLAEPAPDGLTVSEQLREIRKAVESINKVQRQLFSEQLSPELADQGIRIVDLSRLQAAERAMLTDYFEREVFPVLTPLAFDPVHPFPHISNLSLNLAVMVTDPEEGERFARVKIPDVLPRLVPVQTPGASQVLMAGTSRQPLTFVWLEQLVAANLGALFPGLEVVESYAFRVIRDADIEIQEDEAADLSRSIEASLLERRFGSVVQLTVETAMPQRLRTLLMSNLQIGPDDVYAEDSPLGLADLRELLKLDRPDLKDPPFAPRIPPALRATGEELFAVLRRQDVLLHHPFDSFTPVVELIQTAARDPQVLAIKQTLYRVGSHAPVVDALMDAASHGKQVAVLVELKARWDEENNIEWARALERAGVHVAYGMIGLKTHAKIALIVRKERDGIRRYVHMGTGNYNATTARMYTDFGLITSRPEVGADASDLFNYLTGYSGQATFRRLLVGPVSLRPSFLERIEREIACHAKTGDGRLIFKMNSLVDPEMIQALYRASQAGVRVDLLVRGVCCLRPGIPGVSVNIRVTSIVGRFLEHSRIYFFNNCGDEEIYLGSADLMPRNLDRRVETLFPIEDPSLRAFLRGDVLEVYMRDTVNARELHADGSYTRVTPKPDEPPFDSQAYFLAQASGGSELPPSFRTPIMG
ncbi:MAG: Polyphosphate kinase [Chloroflexi bacterium]|nr:Polyphosphate kinase [Chloroflexota bacterium]